MTSELDDLRIRGIRMLAAVGWIASAAMLPIAYFLPHGNYAALSVGMAANILPTASRCAAATISPPAPSPRSRWWFTPRFSC
ncbi:MAG: hypothetical protein JWO65_1359 [Sphingomonas bacterium]|nr:hypothetical protein [Sphingomonas bacterium]